MAELASSLVDLILISVIFGQILEMVPTLVVRQNTEEAVVGIKDLLRGFFQVRVTQKDTSNNIERRLPKNRFHVFDHFLVAIRIGKYDLSVLLRIIQVTRISRAID